jgi:hypothetical protein
MSGALDDLEAQAQLIDSGQPLSSGAGLPPETAPEPDNAVMFAAFSNVALGLLKAIRARVAKGLPEISKEWTDESLQVVADAIPPVINKHLAKLMPLVGDYPEEGALAMACIPLLMGYIAAQGAAGKVSNDKAKDDSAAKAGGEGAPIES